MRELHFTGVHEDGERLLLRDSAGNDYVLPLGDEVRAVARRERRRVAVSTGTATPTLGPREVQAMIRAGATAEEAAERAGWTVEKVHRYDGPILAEREHTAGLAGRARLRGRGADHGTTLGERVSSRLAERGVAAEDISWDAWRSEDGQWTVEVTFAAGGRARVAAWAFSRGAMTVRPLDDEARWLSADDAPDPTASHVVGNREGTEGPRLSGRDRGTGSSRRRPAPASDMATSDEAAGAAPGRPTGRTDEDDRSGPPTASFDLASAVRERSGAAVRRRGTASRRPDPAEAPALPGGLADSPSPAGVPAVPAPAAEEALPLADLRYDPESMPPPPGAHSDPDPDGVDGRPEPAAVPSVPRPQRPEPAQEARLKTPREARLQEAREARPKAPEEVAVAPADPAPPPQAVDPDEVPGARDAESSVAPRPESSAAEGPASDGDPELPFPEATRPAAKAPERAPAAPRARKPSRAKGRSSVPSWDDIMFGAKGE